ncbi:MAG: hypothetical protein JNK64_22975 [Myxococcales bacterium]|nr:hypothetical protein [Myxococcales bacterium]
MRAYVWIGCLALVACKVDGTHYVLPDDGDAAVSDGGIDGSDTVDAGGARLQVSPSTPIDLLEGGSTSVVIRLSAAPTAAVNVVITPSDPGVTTSPTMWTFAPDDWGDKVVTVRAAQDDDAAAISGDVVFQSSVGTVSVPVAVADDDRLGLFVAPTTGVNVLENTDATLQVSLTARPTGNVTVAVTSANGLAVGVSTPSVMFTPGEWDTLKPVTVHAVADGNTTSEQVDVTFAASGLTSVAVPVTVTDDDILNIAVTPASVAGTEGGSAAPELAVSLTQMPPGPVTVNVTASNGHAAAVPSAVFFTTSDFATPKPVRIDLPADVDHADSTAIVTLAATGITPQTVTVTATDPDVQVIQASPGTINTTEGTASIPIGVRLAYAPTSTTTVDLGVAGPIGVDATQLTFTAADYATPKTVHVSVAQDADLVNDSATITLTSPDAATPVTVTLTIADDDTQVINAPSAVTVDEGASVMFDVSLGFQPAGATMVAVASLVTNVNATPSMLTFGPSDWNQPKPVTLTAGPDGNATGETGSVRLSTAGAATVNVNVTVRDTTVTGLTVTPMSVPLTEGGTATVTLRLSADPGGASYVISGVSSDPMSVGIMGSPMVTLNGSNWQTGAVVTLTGLDDANAVGEVATVTWSDGAALSTAATVTVTDNDVLGLAFSPASLTIPEDDERTVNVTLTARPASAVSVNINAGLANYVVGSSTLSFSVDDWNVPHPVTIHSIRDDNRNDENSNVVFNPDAGVPVKTLMVLQSPDDTIWIGRFPGAPTGAVTVTLPTAWAGVISGRNDTVPTLPTCLIMDRLVVVAQVPGNFLAGLYGQTTLPMPMPGTLVYQPPNRLNASAGVNSYSLASTPACTSSPNTYVALAPGMTGQTPMFTTLSSVSAATCPGSGIGSTAGGGLPPTWGSAGACTSSPPPIAYFVVHPQPGGACTCGGAVGKR